MCLKKQGSRIIDSLKKTSQFFKKRKIVQLTNVLWVLPYYRKLNKILHSVDPWKKMSKNVDFSLWDKQCDCPKIALFKNILKHCETKASHDNNKGRTARGQRNIVISVLVLWDNVWKVQAWKNANICHRELESSSPWKQDITQHSLQHTVG